MVRAPAAKRRGLNARYRELAEEFAARVRGELGDVVNSIVLYGSVARKQARRESDVDVLIIGTEPEVKHRIDDATRDLLERGSWELFFGRMFFTKDEFERSWQLGSPFVANVLRDGQVLYDDGIFAGLQEREQARRRARAEGLNMQDPPGYVDVLFSRADEALRMANIGLREGLRSGPVNRAYYAMFYAASAALLADGADLPHRHKTLINLFKRRLVGSGKVNAQLHTDLSNAFDLRMTSDYDLNVEVDGANIEAAVRTAERFVQEMRGFVDR